jgi:hypothetical protein
MRIPIGIFDFAAYAIPGALYFLLLLLLGDTIWPAHDLWTWIDDPTLSQTAVALLACYLLGHATYSLSTFHLPFEQSTTKLARENFLARNPRLVGRPFVDGDTYLLLAAIEAHSALWAASIGSIRATSIMCRNCATALFLLALVVSLRFGLTKQVLPLVPCALGLLLASGLMRRAGRARTIWAKLKTLECAAWIAGIDALGQSTVEAATPAAAETKRAAVAEPSPQLEPNSQLD